MLIQTFPSGPLETNAILFGLEKFAVIDPALGSTEPILQLGHSVELILLTHSHWDHIADVYALKQKTGARVYVHPLDAGNLIHPGSDKLPLYFPIHGVEPDGFLEDGQTLELGGLKIEVIHTPGHSPGCVCFYLREQKVLFSGDTLFQGCIGGLHLPTAQPTLMRKSLSKLAALPPDTRVIPGHGNETTIHKERNQLCR